MEIISHRGYWEIEKEKNSKGAFERAIENGFGIETDIRDSRGQLVISHDMPSGNEMTVEEFFNLKGIQDIPLALNIKADGLQNELKRLLKQYAINDYFVFDMSIPDMLGYKKLEMNMASRTSEYEENLPLLKESTHIWMDGFHQYCAKKEQIEEYLSFGKKVCIVSPELHKRDYKAAWQMLKIFDNENLMICTDFPTAAKEFFNG